MRNRIFLKAMAAFVAVIAVATLTLDISIRRTWENSLRSDIERLLVQNAQGFALRIQNDHQHSLQQMAEEEARITETRATIIAPDGTAVAADRTARRREENFAAVRESRSELEALLNSMTDGVIAVSAEMKVLWANQAITDIVHQPVRMGAPVTDLVRHPDFLSTLRAALQSKQRESSIAASLAGRRSFSITAEPLPDGGVVSVLHDISEIERVEKTRRA